MKSGLMGLRQRTVRGVGDWVRLWFVMDADVDEINQEGESLTRLSGRQFDSEYDLVQSSSGVGFFFPAAEIMIVQLTVLSEIRCTNV